MIVEENMSIIEVGCVWSSTLTKDGERFGDAWNRK